MTTFKRCWVIHKEKVWLENTLSQHFLNIVILHLPAYEDGTYRVFETSAYKIQTPGNYPEESIKHSEHGESLKSRKFHENLTSVNRVFPFGWMDGQTDMTMLTAAFRNFANAPKNSGPCVFWFSYELF
jgi:hypothetical protein